MHKHHVNNKIAFFWYILPVFLVIFFMYMGTLGFRQIASKMAENPNNLIRGCMYYNGYHTSKYNTKNYHFIIDGYRENSGSMHLFNSKIPENHLGSILEYIEKNQNICHEVSYIRINLFFYNKVFLYDFHGNYQSKI